MEIWKDIIGYESLYQVSSLGRVRRLSSHVWNGCCLAQKQGRVLKQGHTRGEYLVVSLCKNNKVKQYRVNRLVAQAFVYNPANLPLAGHKDDDKQNNCADNLYWTDYQENSIHNGKHIQIGEKIGKPIIGKAGKRVIKFQSSLDAKRHGFNASAIRNCLSGRSKTHKGFTWEYAGTLNG